MTDLLKWKHHTSLYSEKPQAMVDLLKSIFQTHRTTCVDCQQLLTLFNTEEHQRVRKWLQANASGGQLDMDTWAQENFLKEEPPWYPNTERVRNQLERYRQALLQRVKAGAKKATNMAKITEVLQKPGESPAAFYERLCEAFWPSPLCS